MNSLTSRVTIPVHLSYIKPVGAYVTELARDMGFTETETNRINLALEETLVNVIEFGYEGRSSESFDLVFECWDFRLVIRIHEKGIPFNPERLPQYQPGRPDLADGGAGLGLHLIRSFMDEVTFIRKGREGQEIRLVKNLEDKRIDRIIPRLEAEEPAEEPAPRPADVPPPDFDIRRMRPDEAVEVSKCAYKCYGYTYEDYVYYPERLAAMNEEGSLYSVVAVGAEGNMMGHAGLKYPYPQAPIAESGVAFVYPDYRRLGLFQRFNAHFIDHARRIGLSGLFGRAVTSHVASQRMAAGHGYKDCGLFLGVFPGDVDFKKIAGKTTQRESGLLSFLELNGEETREIYVTERYRSIVEEVFSSLNVPVRLADGSADSARSPDGPSHMEAAVNTALNMAEMVVHHPGDGLRQELRFKHKEFCLKRIEVIHLVLDLENPHTEALIRESDALGFFFSGVLPYGIAGRHALMLQYLNNVVIDFDRIKLFSPEAAGLLEFIKTEPNLPSLT
jgi:serine/threonine-protein kinase RsbW